MKTQVDSVCDKADGGLYVARQPICRTNSPYKRTAVIQIKYNRCRNNEFELNK